MSGTFAFPLNTEIMRCGFHLKQQSISLNAQYNPPLFEGVSTIKKSASQKARKRPCELRSMKGRNYIHIVLKSSQDGFKAPTSEEKNNSSREQRKRSIVSSISGIYCRVSFSQPVLRD